MSSLYVFLIYIYIYMCVCVIVFERRPTVVTSVCGLPDFWFGGKIDAFTSGAH